jgi:hypothetical protein
MQARVVRRFRVRENGIATFTHAAKVLELAFIERAAILEFDDGSGEAQIAAVRVRVSGGVSLSAIEVRTDSEPAERLEAALKAGWAPVEPS